MRCGHVILRWSLIFLFIPQLFSQKPTSPVNYREIFGDDYEFAVNTIDKNRWWSDSLARHNIDPHFALSVIFPELIRYSSITDYIEVKALEVLYVQYGKAYADFSIGLFQMKPTFAEQIEADILQCRLQEYYPELSLLHPCITDSIGIRKERIIRLQEEKYQLLYLGAFIRIMAKLYPDLEKETPQTRLFFYSTAYNTGYRNGDKVIRCEGDKAYFHPGMDSTGKKYVYSQISLDYYLREME
jgi:hypothetical protein